MTNFIDKLRAKNEEEKKKWVFTLALITTACIAALWLVIRFVFIAPEPRVMLDPAFKEQAEYIFNTSFEQFGGLKKDHDQIDNETTPSFQESQSDEFEDSSGEGRTENEVFFDNDVYMNTETQNFDGTTSTNFFNQ